MGMNEASEPLSQRRNLDHPEGDLESPSRHLTMPEIAMPVSRDREVPCQACLLAATLIIIRGSSSVRRTRFDCRGLTDCDGVLAEVYK